MTTPNIPADTWPSGDRLSWDDDETRLHYDFTEDPPATTPYTDEENAAADERVAAAARAETIADMLGQIAALVDDEPSPLLRAVARLVLEIHP